MQCTNLSGIIKINYMHMVFAVGAYSLGGSILYALFLLADQNLCIATTIV